MAAIELFEPELTCINGICKIGDNTDRARIDAMVKNFIQDGWPVRQYNLTESPAAFSKYPDLTALLEQKGTGVLPVTVVDGRIVKTHDYPTALEFLKWLKGE